MFYSNMFYSSDSAERGFDGQWRMVKPMGYDGKSVERTKMDYPYSYDAFLVWSKEFSYIKNPPNDSHCVYSDRLWQWDHVKYDKCCMEVWGDRGQWFSSRSVETIESFLRLYYDDKKLELLKIGEGCNISNGYPYWVFCFKPTIKK